MCIHHTKSILARIVPHQQGFVELPYFAVWVVDATQTSSIIKIRSAIGHKVCCMKRMDTKLQLQPLFLKDSISVGGTGTAVTRFYI